MSLERFGAFKETLAYNQDSPDFLPSPISESAESACDGDDVTQREKREKRVRVVRTRVCRNRRLISAGSVSVSRGRWR